LTLAPRHLAVANYREALQALVGRKCNLTNENPARLLIGDRENE